MGFPVISMFNQAARLPRLFGVNIGWIIALVLVALVYIYMKKSKQGYEITVVGESVQTARYAGINVKKVILRTMLSRELSQALPALLRLREQTLQFRKALPAVSALLRLPLHGWQN